METGIRPDQRSPLKLEAHAELHDPGTAAAEAWISLSYVWGLCNGASGACIQIPGAVCVDAGNDHVGRQSEVWVIEDIEELRAELQRVMLAEQKILRDRKIQVAEARAVDLIAAQIAESAVSGLRKGEGIQIAGRRRPVGKNGRFTCHHIRALVEVECAAGVVGSDDRNRPARLHGDDGIQLPASPQQRAAVSQKWARRR